MRIRTDGPSGPRVRTGRRLRLAVATLLAVALAVVLLVLTGGDDDRPGGVPAASPTSSAGDPVPPAPATEAAPTSPVSPSGGATPTGGTPAPEVAVEPIVADELPPSLPAVGLDRTADAGDGVTATIEAIEAIEGTGTGPGNVAGPALRVTVRIENRSTDPLDLSGVTVGLDTGEERTPAAPLGDPSTAPFGGTLAPDDAAEGVYVFTVPADDRDLVVVSVGYEPGAPYIVFTGPTS